MKSSVFLGPDCLTASLKEGLSLVVREGEQSPELLHPGVGPASESLELSRQAEADGVLFLGSPPRTLSMVRNRVALLTAVESLGVRHAYLSLDPLRSVRETARFLESHRSPFRLRVLTGDSWRRDGYAVRSESDLDSHFSNWLDEMFDRAPDALILPCRPHEGMRRVLLPFARYAGGVTRFFPALEASLDARGDAVLEALAHPWLEDSVRERLREASVRICERIHFVGVGAMEFWVDGDRAYFVNCAPGLTPGYELWERAAGTRASAWSYLIAVGANREPAMLPESEWNRECVLRAYLRAEDFFRGVPHPGLVTECALPTGPSVECATDLSAERGLLGYVTVRAATWSGAVERLASALTGIWIGGSLQTNESYLAQIVDHPWVREGLFHAAFLDEEFVPDVLPPLEACRKALALVSQAEPGPAVWRIGERVFGRHEAARLASSPERAELMGRLGQKRRVRVGSWWIDAVPVPTVDSKMHPVLAPCSGVVHALWYRETAEVQAHSPMAVIKSMGKFVAIALGAPVTLRRWCVGTGAQIEEGQVLGEVTRGP